MLDEREFELINIVGAEIASSQRDLSRRLNLSLGMTNMLLRRLIAKGYIRIRQLNQKKIDYILTPEGFKEKMRKSVKYTLKTINSIGLIKERFKALLKELYEKGERKFLILGESDLASLIEVAVRELSLKDCHVERIKDLPSNGADGTILVCQEDVFDKIPAQKKVDLIHELAKGHNFLN
ncbi:MAG TPA: winged helix-turn-helix transcriptional regulator [Candidatus Omnitrophota bacterium]|nr:winged helix-turn-helix transcriptional regulator [Candidatus Omnitrophota bacterium]HPD84112.1 winged helix-turn-helix transcriptional regulator [Candidatus Omnitrophota bacterium]HRZ02969.1 winged helix-turn-helix transcriptional regulator [Candidatus Omnitrophota bacterium]